MLNASNFGVPQLRPRVVIVGIRNDQVGVFSYPDEDPSSAPTVGKTLYDLMAENGWTGAKDWAAKANKIAPTLVGGSKNTVDRIWVRQEHAMLGQNLVLMGKGLRMKRQHQILMECPGLQAV